MNACSPTAPNRPPQAIRTATPEQLETAQEASSCSSDGPADHPGAPFVEGETVDYSDDITSSAAGAERESGTDNAPSIAPSGTHPVSGTITQKSLENQSFKPRSRADRRTTASHTPATEPSSSCSNGSVSYALNCRRPIIGLFNRHRGDSGPTQDTGRKPSRNRACQRYIHDHMCRRQRHHPILLMWSIRLS